jgi:RNA recognition motif-containing protein
MKVPLPPISTSKKILETLTQYFSEYGEVEKVDIITEKSNEKPRGFAFVYFLDYEGFQKAVSTVHHLNGRRIDCKEA